MGPSSKNTPIAIRARYAELCQELGHLCNNKRRIDSRIASLQTEIDALDKLAGEFDKYAAKPGLVPSKENQEGASKNE